MKIISILLIIICSSPLFALEIPENERINQWIKEFTTERKQFFQLSVMRSGLYRPIILEIFKSEKIPQDLSWLPFIESGFNCAARSKAKAAGCWQFIKRTGNHYGLKQNTWKDGRFDFNKSTIAAAKYLKELYRSFKDWDLALAAYNSGPTNVRSAIKKSGNNYWNLDLPKETMEYIPEFYAVLTIIRDLKKYGFRNAIGGLITVQLKKGSHNLRYISNKVLSVDYRVFSRLNPGYEIGYTPPGESTTIYLMKNWNVALLRGFGFLAKKNAPRIN